MDIIILVPRPRRYMWKRYTTSRSVCWLCNHCPSIPTNSVTTAVWPPSLHLVMCCVDSSKHPQFGHLFSTFFLDSVAGYCDNIRFVPLKCKTCFVIHTLNLSGKDIMTLCIPSQHTRRMSFVCMIYWQWKRSCATCSHQKCVISTFSYPVILVSLIFRLTPLEGNTLLMNVCVVIASMRAVETSLSALTFTCLANDICDWRRCLSVWPYTWYIFLPMCDVETRFLKYCRTSNWACFSRRGLRWYVPCRTTPILSHPNFGVTEPQTFWSVIAAFTINWAQHPPSISAQ
jgi:hypothetical protein